MNLLFKGRLRRDRRALLEAAPDAQRALESGSIS